MDQLAPIQADEPTPGGLKNHRFRRGIYLLPSILTVANILCGYYAVLATLKGTAADLDNAARAIGFAILFDILDGRVARATGTNSEFGKQFDSLADVVSFGVAPAFLSFAWGVRGMRASDAHSAHVVYQLGWIISFIFVICCAWRLARFNIHGMASEGRYFIGLPTPAAAGLIAASVHAFWSPLEDWRAASVWLIVVLGLALLMSSTVRYVSFKTFKWRSRIPSLSIILVALLVGAIVFYSEIVLLVIAGTYVIQGLVLYVVRLFRRPTSAPESGTA
jgi:CDP-diacylglycerol---serine O-phosphatidyltransferase